MKAVVTSFNRSLNNWQVRTFNDIAVAFSTEAGFTLKLNAEVEIDLPHVVERQELLRVATGHTIRIRLRENDLHDLRLPGGHGRSRKPSAKRLNEA